MEHSPSSPSSSSSSSASDGLHVQSSRLSTPCTAASHLAGSSRLSSSATGLGSWVLLLTCPLLRRLPYFGGLVNLDEIHCRSWKCSSSLKLQNPGLRRIGPRGWSVPFAFRTALMSGLRDQNWMHKPYVVGSLRLEPLSL